MTIRSHAAHGAALAFLVSAVGPAVAAAPPAPIAGTSPAVIARPAPAPAVAAAPPAAGPVRRREPVTASMQAISQANAAALATPAAGAFVNAALVYDFEIGRLYRIDASPGYLTSITLRPGEHLVSKASGDTVRWVIGETSQGLGDSAQTVILVKPIRAGAKTNLVLTTDQRTYYLEAVSHEQPIYTSVISWNYPADDLRDQQAAAAKIAAVQLQAQAAAASAAAALAAPVVDSGLVIDHLNFGYRIDHPGARTPPVWQPVRAFDDGAKTYIQFPAALASTDAPPLFLVGADGKAQLVNYRVRGGYYIVDRLFDVAELRLGETPQAIVRITRTGGAG